jgi:hypothetical protein
MSHSINTLGSPPRRPGRSGGDRPGREAGASPDGSPTRERPAGSPYRNQADWGQAVLFGAGIALGALLGAGAALLTAPQSGVETRLALKRRARRARVQAEDRWDGLGRELRGAARRRKRDLRRKIAESRWRASDAFEG